MDAAPLRIAQVGNDDGNDLTSVSAIDIEIAISSENDAVGSQFAQANHAGIGDRHRGKVV
jgi:hypothetical protein